MRKTREQIEYQLSIKRNRLDLYLKREAEMLDGGVQSYGIGSPATTPTSDPSGPPSNSSRQTSKPSRPH